MEFTKLKEGHNCNCIENAKIDTNNLYAIKTMKNILRPQDFNSYWEKGKRPDVDDCFKICSLKGVSMSLFNNETKDEVSKIFKILFPLSPKYKPFISIVKIHDDAGVVKHTPDEVNQHHFDFYKSDTFDYTKMNLESTNELR
jgi:hypothetical protein